MGIRSATIYVPQYNLIKEVPWNGNASYTEKDRIELVMRGKGEKIVREFQRNDSLDVEIQWEKHQEIQMSIVIDHKGESIKI